jgi:hypothetical protein
MSGARVAAIAELRTRLGHITIANGFNTDAGDLVFLCERPQLGPDDPVAAVALVVGADEPGHQGEHVVLLLPVSIQAHVKVVADDPWMTVEAIVEDIKRAIETDHDLDGALLPRGLERGSTEPLEREDGSSTVGCGVEYRLRFKERWGAP